MPVSKAQMKATQRYKKKAYDRILLEVPKGRRETIRRAAAGRRLSVNGYIAALVCADLHMTPEKWKARTEDDAEENQGDG